MKMNSQSVIRSRDWLPQNIAVLGAGKSGIAAAQFLVKLGKTVFISDTCGTEKLRLQLSENGLSNLTNEADGHTEKILEHDLIICSPGIRSDHFILQKAGERGIPVWSEIELAYRHSKAPYLAVTGSSGKSTVISLAGSICKAAGKEYVVAGNIGLPLISVAPSLPANGFVAAEISSFQLETIDSFKPRSAAILNFMKNHLDRYSNEEEYYNAKKRIIMNMTKDDTLILNALDTRLTQWALNLKNKIHIVYFGEYLQDVDCIWNRDGVIYIRFMGHEEKILDIRSLKIKGNHNISNVCAAAALTYSAGIDARYIEEGASSFSGLTHRLEFVRNIDGVEFYNDSKSTTAESVLCAVNAFGNNVHLIAGGRDKGCDFSVVRDSIRKNVKSVILIGEAATRIEKEWRDLTDITIADSLSSAVAVARNKSNRGDVVILSPGCSSFDMFSNFEHRGEAFKKIINELHYTGEL